MNKSELVEAVAARSNSSKAEVDRVLGAFFDTLAETVKSGDRIAWPKFGSFSLAESKARTGRNPQTGAPVKIKASKRLRFSQSSSLKEFINSKAKKR